MRSRRLAPPRAACCGPYRGRVVLMLVALLVATAAALAPPYLAGRAIDEGIHGKDTDVLTVILIAVHRGGAGQLGRHLRCRPT